MKKAFLILNCILLFTGNCGGPLILRLYFIHGGSRIWLSSALDTAGFPILLIPLLISYFYRRKIRTDYRSPVKLTCMTRKMLIASAVTGVLTGAVNYFYSCGSSKLPVSTSSLIYATQMAFTAGFAFVLVKQKFTAYSINAVVLLMIGAAVLALGGSSDRPEGESNKAYVLGFVMTLLSAFLYGFVLVYMEVSLAKANEPPPFTVVLEFQAVMCIFASVFCTVGMLINKDFQAISREAKQFELGEGRYYMVIVFSTIVWQIFFLGAIGTICHASALLSGLLITASLSVTEILAVIFFHEKFGGEKGVSLALSLWGFVSYFYGEMKQSKNNNSDDANKAEMTHDPPINP